MLGATRVLYGLAMDGRAPKIFTRLNRFAIPYFGVALFGASMCLGFMTLSSGASVAFDWLQDLVSISTLVNWLTICVTYLRFYYGMKKQGIPRSALPWAAPLQPYITWVSMIIFSLLLLTGGYATFIHGHWSDETFVSSYINIPLFAILYFGYKFIKKTSIVALKDIPIQVSKFPLLGLILFRTYTDISCRVSSTLQMRTLSQSQRRRRGGENSIFCGARWRTAVRLMECLN